MQAGNAPGHGHVRQRHQRRRPDRPRRIGREWLAEAHHPEPHAGIVGWIDRNRFPERRRLSRGPAGRGDADREQGGNGAGDGDGREHDLAQWLRRAGHSPERDGRGWRGGRRRKRRRRSRRRCGLGRKGCGRGTRRTSDQRGWRRRHDRCLPARRREQWHGARRFADRQHNLQRGRDAVQCPSAAALYVQPMAKRGGSLSVPVHGGELFGKSVCPDRCSAQRVARVAAMHRPARMDRSAEMRVRRNSVRSAAFSLAA